MKAFNELYVPSDRVLTRIRENAFGSLSHEMSARVDLSLVPRVYPAGHTLLLVDRKIVVRQDAVIVFVDHMPGANFGHRCGYRFHSPEDGRLLYEEEAAFPPNLADPTTVLERFHAPLRSEFVRPMIFKGQDWKGIRPWRWRQDDDNRFALLFTSQISDRRHVEDLELAWRILRHRLGFPAENLYVVCYDGTIGAFDVPPGQMGTWVGDDTPYQMGINASATKQNLQDTLTAIGARMNADSLLFVHTNNHASTAGLCIDFSTVVTPAEWGAMLGGMPAFGKLVVTMQQCYSGAFSQPTLDHSTARLTSFASSVPPDGVSDGATHFDPWARIWFEGLNGFSAYGANLPTSADVNRNGQVSVREAFDYSNVNDEQSGDDPQYADKPAGCGSEIYLSRSPTLAELVAELASRSAAIEDHLRQRQPPLPDPPPGLEGQLAAALTVIDAFASRLGVGGAAPEQARERPAASAIDGATAPRAAPSRFVPLNNDPARPPAGAE
jgi:hypothetical protein